MDKLLILRFRNAGLFRKHRNTKDKIFDINRRDRKNELEFIEPITVNHISNMLHVLFGERPKPSVRETVYDKNEHIFNLANESFLRIDSYKDEKGKFYAETMQLKKAVGNSWNPVSYMNFNRVKQLCQDRPELFKLFTDTISEVFNINIENTTFNDVKNMILNSDDNRLKEMFSVLNRSGKKPLYSCIFANNDNAPISIFINEKELKEKGKIPKLNSIGINENKNTILTVLTGLDKIIKLSGEILIPVSEDDIIKIKKNKGSATLLDGGFVYIVGVKNNNMVDKSKFTKIKEFSLQKQ